MAGNTPPFRGEELTRYQISDVRWVAFSLWEGEDNAIRYLTSEIWHLNHAAPET